MVRKQKIEIEDGGLLLFADAFAGFDMQALLRETCWTQHQLRIFGRSIAAPRLSAWHGEPGCTYRYSGLTLSPAPLGPALGDIRARIATLSGHDFNCVLLNLYRDGRDSMSWHSDDEAELGPAPRVASLSLGETRRFALRRRGETRTRLSVDLHDGSLLLMEPPLQAHWQHALPKTRRICGARLNLTWRSIDSTMHGP